MSTLSFLAGILLTVVTTSQVHSLPLNRENSFLYQQSLKDTVVRVNPPVNGFYAKYLNCNGIPIRSALVVSDSALIIASAKIKMMLNHMPEAHKNLVKSGAEFHIIGKDQQTSDLPEFLSQKGKSYIDNTGKQTNIDDRTRGMGGITASCGEENLLRLPTDRYKGGYDILIHEFAHTIMFFGLDTVLQNKIKAQYKLSTGKGLWKGAYAATDAGEYWAELSMWYFGYRGDFVDFAKSFPSPGPQSLRDYDIAGYQLLDSIYKGSIKTKVLEKKVPMFATKGDKSDLADEKAQLLVNNNSAGKLKLYWIGYDGKPVLYETLTPKTQTSKWTFVTHVWLLEKEDGDFMYVRVNESPFKVDVK